MRTAIVFGLLVAATPALGAYFDGNALHELCKSDRVSASYYVLGATTDLSGVCAPQSVTVGQVVDTVCVYAHYHKAALALSAFEMTQAAIQTEWPCH